MKLLLLALMKYKNLNNLKIYFEGDQPYIIDHKFYNYSNESSMMFFLGENGSGKTSIFEAIMAIFSSFYSPIVDEKYLFDYHIKYFLNGHIVSLSKMNEYYGYSYSCSVDDRLYEFKKFNEFRYYILNNEDTYIPQKIVTSYSGINDRLKPIYNNIQNNYKKNLTRNNIKMNELFNRDNVIEHGISRFVHSIDEDISLYLPVIWLDDEKSQEIIRDTCGIDSVSKIRINFDLTYSNLLRIIPEYRKENYKQEKLMVDNKINSEYKYLKKYNFNDKNNSYIESRHFELNFGNYIDKSVELLRELFESNIFREVLIFPLYSINKQRSHRVSVELDLNNIGIKGRKLFDFLKYCKSQYKSSVDVYISKKNKEFLFEELSEGEYQLIKILGMLILTKDNSGLVLLDEPDAHLNPKWKYKFKEIMDKLLSNITDTQVLINTHDPLIVNGSTYNEVMLIYRENNYLSAEKPSVDAIGKSIDGLLHSQYFNLDTTIDYITKNKIDEREKLYKEYRSIIKSNEIKTSEIVRIEESLEKLNNDISKLPFTKFNTVDKFYEEYLLNLKEMSLEIDLNKIDKSTLDERKSKIKKIILDMIKR